MGNFLPWDFVGRGKRNGATDAGLTAKKQRRSGNQPAPAKIFGDGKAIVQRPRHFAKCKRSDGLCHQARAEIAVGRQFVCGNAPDGGIAGQVDGVGNERRRRIGLGASPRENGDGVGNAK